MQEKLDKNIFYTLPLAKGGDERALSAIITKYMPALRKYASYAKMPGLDFEDAVQEGLIGLFRAVQTYKKDQPASFNTYANVCIQNAVLTARKTAGRKKHLPLNHSVPFPDSVPFSISSPEEKAIASENVTIVLRKAKSLLSPREKQVLYHLLRGYSKKEIAKKLSFSLKSVENTLLRIRNKLK